MTDYNQAHAAAAYWQGRLSRLIRNRENAVFEMETPSGRAALRLHRAGYQDDASIGSELWWCAALADAGAAVARPIASRDGSLMITLQNGQRASAFHWQPGEPLGETGVPFSDPVDLILDRHRALGRLIAQVHIATDSLRLPEDFVRHRWDIAGLVGDNPLWGRFWEHPAADPAQTAELCRIRAWLKHQISEFATADFGLIHADVLRENVLVNDGSLNLIDFDDSGYGFRGYDLGTAMLGNVSEPAYPRILEALIEGYANLRPISREAVEVFTLARTCASVGWTMPRLAADDRVHRSHIARCVAYGRYLIP